MNDQLPASNPPAGNASVNPLGTDLEVVADSQMMLWRATDGTAYTGVLHLQGNGRGLLWACEHEHQRPTQAIACAVEELDRRYGPPTPGRSGGPVDLAAVNARLDRAYDEVGDLAKHGAAKRWRMSIPANPGWDSDLVIGDALMDALWVVEELRAAREVVAAVPAVERLRALAVWLDDIDDHYHDTGPREVQADLRRLADCLAAYDEAIKGSVL